MNESQEGTHLRVSAEVAEALERWVGEGRFGSVEQACRFGIIVALARGVMAPSDHVPDVPVMSLMQFDTSDSVCVAVQLLYPTASHSLYRTLERLAEGGLRIATRDSSLLGESGERIRPNGGRAGTPGTQAPRSVEDEILYLQSLLSSVSSRYGHRRISRLGLPTRAERALQRAGIRTLADLRACTAITLRGIPNFGQKSIRDVSDAIEALLGTFDESSDDNAIGDARAVDHGKFAPSRFVEGDVDPSSESDHKRHSRTMAELLSGSLQKLNRREGLVLRGRLGFSGKILTLQELGDDIGITRERVRQIESSAANKARLTALAEIANSKLKSLLDSEIEAVNLEDLEQYDAWFAGTDVSSKFLPQLLKRYCEDPVHFHQFGKKRLATRASPRDVESLVVQSVNRIQQAVPRNITRMNVWQIIDAECMRAGYPEARSLVNRKLSGSLHFSSSAREESDVLLALGKNMEARALAVLKDHGSPMHYQDVAKAIADSSGKSVDERTVHNALPRSGAVLVERGVYGLPEWISLDADTKHRICRAAEEVMSMAAIEKQWHSQELLDELATNRPELPLPESIHILSAILKQNSNLKYLKRQVWALRVSGYQGAASRFDIRALCEEILDQSGRPMTTEELRNEVSQRRGLGSAFQIHPGGELVKLGRGLWGLKGRNQ